MGLTKADLADALGRVTLPGESRDLLSAGAVRATAACDGRASVRLSLPTSDRGALDRAAALVARAVAERAGPGGLEVLAIEFVDESGRVVHQKQFGGAPAEAPEAQPGHRPIGGLKQGPAPSPSSSAQALPGVRHAIAVGAGKGGVGKSTIAVNLAVGLARGGDAVGLLDGDIYGPSLPTMLGLRAMDQVVTGGQLQPFLVHGVKAITIGKLVDPDKPLIWRGPMAHGAFTQLVTQTSWGELDHLVIDLPPGTGDVSLTMAQSVRMTRAVVVCTPQRVALDDALRAVRMFQQLSVEVLGIVENMSCFVGDDGKTYDLFGRGGARQMADRLGLPFLGEVPITMALREHSDSGEASANFDRSASGDALVEALEGVVSSVRRELATASIRQGQSTPTLRIR